MVLARVLLGYDVVVRNYGICVQLRDLLSGVYGLFSRIEGENG